MTTEEANILWVETNAMVEAVTTRLQAMYSHPEHFRKHSVGRALMMIRSVHSETKTCQITKEDTNVGKRANPGTAG